MVSKLTLCSVEVNLVNLNFFPRPRYGWTWIHVFFLTDINAVLNRKDKLKRKVKSWSPKTNISEFFSNHEETSLEIRQRRTCFRFGISSKRKYNSNWINRRFNFIIQIWKQNHSNVHLITPRGVLSITGFHCRWSRYSIIIRIGIGFKGSINANAQSRIRKSGIT